MAFSKSGEHDEFFKKVLEGCRQLMISIQTGSNKQRAFENSSFI